MNQQTRARYAIFCFFSFFLKGGGGQDKQKKNVSFTPFFFSFLFFFFWAVRAMLDLACRLVLKAWYHSLSVRQFLFFFEGGRWRVLPSLGELGNVPFVRRRKNNIKKKKKSRFASNRPGKQKKNKKYQGSGMSRSLLKLFYIR